MKSRPGIFSPISFPQSVLFYLYIQGPGVLETDGILLCGNTCAERVDVCFYSSFPLFIIPTLPCCVLWAKPHLEDL